MAPHPDSDSKSKRRKLKLRVFMKSTKFKIPGKYDMPIRVRLWFILFTCVIMIILALLGFTNSSKAWIPLNHKVLRFTCFTLATGVMYFVVDVDEDARRVWYWRNCSLLFVLFVCFFCGGIVSEFVQAMLITTKEFKMGDIIANLLGSTVGLAISYHLEKYYRHRREIARLYRPVAPESPGSDSEESTDEDEVNATQLLPVHYSRSHGNTSHRPGTLPQSDRALKNVWDEREELFGIGDSEDESDGEPQSRKYEENRAPDKSKTTTTPL
jgi:hypothetical protein